MSFRALLMLCGLACAAMPLAGCLGDNASGYYAPLVPAIASQHTDRSNYVAFGDSITCGYVAGSANTTVPFNINDPSCHTANAFPSYIASATGLGLANYGIPSAQACDLWVREIVPENANPVGKPLYTVLIGTNDAGAKGAGVYEPVFTACSIATLTWLAIPAEDKVMPAAASANGWTLGSSPQLGAYATTQIPGATLTFTLTTTGGPIYLWHNLFIDYPGSSSYTVDGKPMGTFDTRPPAAITTIDGTLNSVAAERIANVAAGTHTVTVTLVYGVATVLGVGTPASALAARPLVLAGQCTLPSSAASATLVAALDAYSADTLALVKTLSGDGLNIVYAPNHNYMTGSAAEMTDLLHVTPLGASNIAKAFLAVTP